MGIKAFYPSGAVLDIKGKWTGPIKVGEQCSIMIHDFNGNAGEVMLGDPRGVYQDKDTGEILYEPRANKKGMNKWILDWLRDNPSWPSLLELSNV